MRTLAFAVIDELAQFQTDSLGLKLEALTTISKSLRGQNATAFIDRINSLIDEAVSADRYDVARQLAGLAVTSAKASKELCIKAATGRAQEVKNAEAAYGQVKKSLDALAENAKDPEPNLAVGTFYCFTKGQWEKGLPMLASGSDAALKGLAEKELAKPTDADRQVELGDGWWVLAEKETGAAERRMRERADYWYQQALPNLTGLTKAKVKKRLTEISARGLAFSPEDSVVWLACDRSSTYSEKDKSFVKDLSGHQNDAELFDATISQCGDREALRFEGTGQFAMIQPSTSLDFKAGDDFTVAFWVKCGDISSRESSIVEKWKMDAGKYDIPYPFVIRQNYTDICGVVYNGAQTQDIRGTKVIKHNAWLHVVLEKNGKSALLFVNGNFKVKVTVPHGEIGNDLPIYLGRRGGVDPLWFKGMIHHFIIFSRALSQEEVGRLYSQTK